MSDDLLDSELLGELRDIMADDFTRLVEAFIQDGKFRCEAMRAALQAGDGEQLRQLAHSLKGSSSNLGAHRLTGLCLELEQQALSDMDAAAVTLQRIEPCLQEVCLALKALDSGASE